jgi:hypothetical protein
LLGLAAVPHAWTSPGTQDLKGEVVNEKGQALAGAVCTLRGPVSPEQGLLNTTGEKGEFGFRGLVPGTYGLTCAAVTYQPVVQGGIEVTETQAPFVQVVLPAEIVIREKVEVRDTAPTVALETAAPPARLSAPQLRTLPLTEQQFKAALPLVPGVVRTPDGKMNIKGQVETQGMLLVDSAETVDPVTGSFAIEVPLDAVESLEVHKTAYLVEYGRFSGGLTSIQTQTSVEPVEFRTERLCSHPADPGRPPGGHRGRQTAPQLDGAALAEQTQLLGILHLCAGQATGAGPGLAEKRNQDAGVQLLHQLPVRLLPVAPFDR